MFRRVGGSWVREAKLLGSDTTYLDYFGDAVAVDGQRIVVIAPFHQRSAGHKGSGYQFVRTPEGWSEAERLDPADRSVGFALDLREPFAIVWSGVIFGVSGDCNANGVADPCDVAGGTSADCDNDAVPDECDLRDGTSPDCNANGIPDDCDIHRAPGSKDGNANGIPDECEEFVPSASAWGLLILGLCIAAAGKGVYRKKARSPLANR